MIPIKTSAVVEDMSNTAVTMDDGASQNAGDDLLLLEEEQCASFDDRLDEVITYPNIYVAMCAEMGMQLIANPRLRLRREIDVIAVESPKPTPLQLHLYIALGLGKFAPLNVEMAEDELVKLDDDSIAWYAPVIASMCCQYGNVIRVGFISDLMTIAAEPTRLSRIKREHLEFLKSHDKRVARVFVCDLGKILTPQERDELFNRALGKPIPSAIDVMSHNAPLQRLARALRDYITWRPNVLSYMWNLATAIVDTVTIGALTRIPSSFSPTDVQMTLVARIRKPVASSANDDDPLSATNVNPAKRQLEAVIEAHAPLAIQVRWLCEYIIGWTIEEKTDVEDIQFIAGMLDVLAKRIHGVSDRQEVIRYQMSLARVIAGIPVGICAKLNHDFLSMFLWSSTHDVDDMEAVIENYLIWCVLMRDLTEEHVTYELAPFISSTTAVRAIQRLAKSLRVDDIPVVPEYTKLVTYTDAEGACRQVKCLVSPGTDEDPWQMELMDGVPAIPRWSHTAREIFLWKRGVINDAIQYIEDAKARASRNFGLISRHVHEFMTFSARNLNTHNVH